MSLSPKAAFQFEPIHLPLDSLFPTRIIKDPEKHIKRYATILSSIREIGMIEPIIVYPQRAKKGAYLILDGHLRHAVLNELRHTEAECLISTDDEAFTYNARISRVSPIQEHRMIMKAVRSGVSPERIATALNMKVRDVKAMMNLLNDIHPEAADLLKEKPISPKAIWLMRRVHPQRQIEMAELMVSLDDFSIGYAEALLFGTPKQQLLKPDEPKVKKGLSTEEITRMEAEMEGIEQDFRAVEQSYGENVLNFTVARTYLKKLLENARVCKFLSAKHPDLFSAFQEVIAMEAI